MTTDARPDRTEHVVREAGLVLLAQVGTLVFGVLNNFLIARLAGPEGKGLLYLVQLITNVGLSLFAFGLGPAAVFYLGQKRGYSKGEITASVISSSLMIGMLPMALMSAMAPWILPRTSGWLPPGYLWLAMAAIPATILAYNTAFLLLGLGRIRDYNLYRMSTPALLSVLLLGLWILRHWTLPVLAGAWFLSLLAPALAAPLLFANVGAWKSRIFGFVKAAFGFGWKAHIGSVLQYLQFRMDALLVGALLPLRDLGVYSLAVSLAELLWNVPLAVSTVLLPHIAAATHNERVRITPIVCRVVLATTLALSLAVAAGGSLMVVWLLPSFRPSIPVLWVLLPGVVVASIFRVLSSDFNGRGEPIKTVYGPLLSTALMVPAGLWLIPRYGIISAAILTSISYTLTSVVYVLLYRRTTGVPVLGLLWLRSSDISALRNLARSLRTSVLGTAVEPDPGDPLLLG